LFLGEEWIGVKIQFGAVVVERGKELLLGVFGGLKIGYRKVFIQIILSVDGYGSHFVSKYGQV